MLKQIRVSAAGQIRFSNPPTSKPAKPTLVRTFPGESFYAWLYYGSRVLLFAWRFAGAKPPYVLYVLRVFFAGPTETARKTLIFQKVNPLNIYREVTFRLQCVDKFVIINLMRNTRPISWLKAARKNFEEFPEDVQSDMLDALTIAAEGGKSDKAKPFKGVDVGVFEIALRYPWRRFSHSLCC